MAIYTQSDFEKDKAEHGSAFDTLYDRMQALEGSSGNRASYVASQELHSRGLREKGLPDTSIFGTSRDIFGRDRFETQDKNPMSNYRAQPKIPTSPQINQMLADQAMGIGGAPTGGFFPSLAGPGPKRNPQGFIETMSQTTPGMREAFGMGLANIASGGAFSSDPNVKMQKFLEQGFGADQAQRYLQDTARTNARLAQDRFVYGDRINERGGTQATQATAATGEVDPTADPNYIPPHLRYLMEQQQPVTTMSMGGIMALRPMMQQQQYNMGRQMAMRDMGKSA
jgi:hypothetical protein